MSNSALLRLLIELPEDVVEISISPPSHQPNNLSMTAEFERFPHLTILRLRHSGITNLGRRSFEKLQSLRVLDISGNDIEAIPPDTFEGCDHIEELQLDSNSLFRHQLVTSSFVFLKSLKVLSLRRNGISQIPTKLFNGLNKLERLYLDENQLEPLTGDILNDLGNLKLLSMSNCGLKTIPSNFLSNNLAMETLHLSNNLLPAIPAAVIKRLPALKTLDLTGNSIRSIADFAFEATSVETLLLGDNLLGLKTDGVDHLPMGSKAFAGANISRLDFSYNHFTSFTSSYVSSASQLKILHIGGNYLREILPTQTTGLNLTELSLNRIGLTQIPSSLPQEYQRLKTLNFSGNRLAYLPVIPFANMSSLEILDVSDNNLTSLNGENLRFIRRLKQIFVHQNPWDCQCEILGFVDFLTEFKEAIRCNDDKEFERIRCDTPKSFAGVPVISLKQAEVVKRCYASPIFGVATLSEASEFGIIGAGVAALVLLLILTGSVLCSYTWAHRRSKASTNPHFHPSPARSNLNAKHNGLLQTELLAGTERLL